MVVNVIVSGPVGSGKSALVMEIVGALRAIGVEAESVGVSNYDTGGDPIASLEIYRDALKVIVSESLFTQSQVEMRVGGSYELPDRPGFWIDAPVAREIARRALGTSPSANDRLIAKKG
jgi:hypothetical protein